MQRLIRQLVATVVALGAFFAGQFLATQQEASPSATPGVSLTGSVVRVIDGDTITARIDGADTTIRFIGIDARETATSPRAGGTAECFATEATEALEGKLPKGTLITLEGDDSQSKYDKYGRLLAYVFVDGVNINEWLVREGYAHEYTYSSAYKYQSAFKSAEREARASARGFWAPGACPSAQ